MKYKRTLKQVRARAVLLCLVVFLALNSFAHMQIQHYKNEEQLAATYTAEATVRRIEAQLNRYLSRSDLLKNIIESGVEIDNTDYSELCRYMLDNDGVIQAIELAPNGVVNQVYPLDNNEEAMGLDLIDNAERGKNAILAKNSGKYTLAGPFQLVQGGTGCLLMAPVYRTANGTRQFWGFSVLVIDWDRFVNSLQLDKLETASYHYEIWKTDLTTGERVTIARCQDGDMSDALEVLCTMPNDTWHFAIKPAGGWYSMRSLVLNTLLCLFVAILVSIIYYQNAQRHYRDALYAEEIRRSAEEARAANAAKTGFLSRMSHDIRTPLNGIIGLLNIDEAHPDDQALIVKNRQKMRIAANQLLDLINDVLQMGKLESGEVVLAHEVVDLHKLTVDIGAIIEQRAADAGVTLELDPASDRMEYRYVYGSSLHLRQIFLNIYGNGIKYNRVGGKVRTLSQCLGAENGIVTYRWTITDNGIGMSQEFLQHIFEPFAQERTDARSVYNGTGLGMAIVKGLVDKMNGTITVTSQEGEGSTFVITLPFEIASPDQLQPDHALEQADIHGLRLLLAEDNSLNAEIATVLLEDQGAIVTLAKDGQQAIDLFEKSAPGWYDAILMDVMMPNVDGLTATRIIRALDRPDAETVPIIALTANAFSEDAHRCLDAGMNAHLSKPLNMPLVMATIARFTKHSTSV